MKLLFVILHFVRTLALELSDQNAYGRYLAISGRPHSKAAWREFSDQRHRRKYQNAKCC
jgi:hypothetical protein